MTQQNQSPEKQTPDQPDSPQKKNHNLIIGVAIGAAFILIIALVTLPGLFSSEAESENPPAEQIPLEEQYSVWVERSYKIGERFKDVYSAGWEGANGAIGNAYLFAVTNDSSLLKLHTDVYSMLDLYNGTWVDDRAWACLAEMYWWDFTGRTNQIWVEDAKQRYVSAKQEGRLSNHEGYWTWYNWVPGTDVGEPIFTNSNMNQMVSVACWLYEATGDEQFLNDALLVWNGDGTTPGIEQTLYKGNGKWEGAPGRAAFGKELPWEGVSYCSIGAAMYRVTKDEKYKDIAVATAKRVMDPDYGWVHPEHYYQINMDGNGAFVHFLLDAYMIAPDELPDIPMKVRKMLDHVWTNAYGKARVTLHRTQDHAIRNGWNPNGGEDGYGVDLVGTVHPQSQALRAYGVYAYVYHKYLQD
ncbi:MAG: hypothetical protein CL946_03410 [Ectothiorhodospiraceae bacterium]|nr:hypothetical protein [Ectothiorhodospiraceae bacterium]